MSTNHTNHQQPPGAQVEVHAGRAPSLSNVAYKVR